MAFKDRLKEARLKNRMTQEQIAEKLGVAKSTFTGYETGNSEPNMLTVSKIMKILDVDANFLWQDEMNASGGSPIALKYDELELIKKYRFLINHSPVGKRMVDNILEHEYETAQQINDLIEIFGEEAQRILRSVPGSSQDDRDELKKKLIDSLNNEDSK